MAAKKWGDDPVRKKLKEWQEANGRLKENKLPWESRRKVKKQDDCCEPDKKALRVLRPKNADKLTDRRALLEAWKEKNGSDRRKTIVYPKISSPKKYIAKKEIKSTIPPPSQPSKVPRPEINFITLNKKRLKEFKDKRMARRETVPDARYIRRSSLEKIKPHTAVKSIADVKYYCLRPSMNKSRQTICKTPSEKAKGVDSNSFTIHSDGKDHSIPSSQKHCSSPKFVTPKAEITKLKQSSEKQFKYLITPVKQFPSLNIFSSTPVRRSLRLSTFSPLVLSTIAKSRCVVDNLDNIPEELKKNLIYCSNPALDNM